jgi:ABC-type lipoprotein release transport system permease subunit
VLVLYTALFEGFLAKLERNLVEIELGDLQIFAPGYRDRPSLYTTIDDVGPLLAGLEQRGFSVAPRLLAGGLVASGEASAGASLRGIDVSRDARVSRIHDQLADGAWLEPGDPDGAVVGAHLARTLGVGPGDELVVVSQATDGSIANDLFTIRGVLGFVGEETDRAGVFLTEGAFRELFVLRAGAHQLMVRRPPRSQPEEAVAEARRLAPGLDVASWRELNPTLASMLDSTRTMMGIIFLIIYLAVAILILNATLMAVFERMREFGVLKAIGMGPEHVLLLILAEGGVQTAIAIGVALTLSVPGLWYLRRFGIDLATLSGTSMAGIVFDPVWQAKITPYVFYGPLTTLLVIVLLGTLYPALKAARLAPVEAMRHR